MLNSRSLYLNLRWMTIFSVLFCANVHAKLITLHLDLSNSQISFAAEELEQTLLNKDHQIKRTVLTPMDFSEEGIHIVLCLMSDEEAMKQLQSLDEAKPSGLSSEGFSIRMAEHNGQTSYWGIGAESAGSMYGGLELEEMIRVGGLDAVEEVKQNPYMQLRGTKFNIPLDVRTPSYSDVSDAAQNNIGEMWSFEFWKDYIDHLARFRYNFVSLWSLHPFPSLVKVPEYPDVALDDVKRSTVQWDEHYTLEGRDFDRPEILNNVETLKKMSIEEKIEFWRRVMRYGKERNIDFYFITWNIFVYGTEGKYGITDDIGNETTIDYFRQSVKQMFLTYPDLKGIGLTTGENMPGASFQEKEEWAFQTYAQGVMDAVKELPKREITFVHRQHQTGAQDIAKIFKPLIEHENVDFIFSFKYAKAHVFSSTIQPYHRGFVQDIGELETIWTLRNDDAYRFRWGAPDFVREFIGNIPYEVSRGFYYGSDQYIWGREFMSLMPEDPRQIELAKHWYHWLIWGRLGYNPNVDNGRFVNILDQRYPQVSGEELFGAWQMASMAYPKVTGFHWGSLDFRWYIEACQSRPGPANTETGFHDVNRFITLDPHPGTDNISIPDYVEQIEKGEEPKGTTPIEVSQQIHRNVDQSLERIEEMNPKGNKELRLTLEDIRAVSFMGKYYAHKIRGALELALYRANNQEAHQQKAIGELNQAAKYWRAYSSVALGMYQNPLWTNRVGYCNYRETYGYVLGDIETAGGEPDIDSMAATPGGDILPADDANHPSNDFGETWWEWTYNAPQAGLYLLELQYTIQPGEHPCSVTVNGNNAGELILWSTGVQGNWVWDRKAVHLKKGENTILLRPTGSPKINHLNVLLVGK